MRTEFGGFIFADFENPSSETIGLAFAIIILIVAFGSVLAMGLPIGVALFGIGLGTALTTILSQLVTVPEFATFLGIMIGLGVGIDYALLIVTRYREQLHGGHGVRDSITVAIDTAGRSVLFAGITVVISLLSMILMQVTFVTGLADQRGVGGRPHGGRVAHAPPRAARLRQAPDRAHPLAGPDRRRPHRGGPRRGRPQDLPARRCCSSSRSSC